MAWTWQTAAFFIFIACCLIAMTVWEKKKPGGSPRKGILGLDTTRGDRLFLSLLSAAYIHRLAWFDRPNVMGGNYYFVFLCYFCIQVRIIIL